MIDFKVLCEIELILCLDKWEIWKNVIKYDLHIYSGRKISNNVLVGKHNWWTILFYFFQYFDLAADVLAENAHLTYKFLTPVR